MKIACLLGIALVIVVKASGQTNSYTVTPIVDNTVDQYLINPWGMSRPESAALNDNEWWLSDNGTGVSTLYRVDRDGINSLSFLVVTIPSASGTGIGSPTGTTYNGVAGPGPGVNNFTFATLDGTISNWNAGSKPPPGGTRCYECHVSSSSIVVNHSSSGASYIGLTLATNAMTNLPAYYASNFNGGVEAYDATSFLPLTLRGTFSDPRIPASYKPYGIQTVGSLIWVTFYNSVSGGYVDGFDTNGRLKVRLAKGKFSEPWGIAQAPGDFGFFSNMLLVGNTTSGRIGAFDPNSGAFKGYLQGSTGRPLVIPGLWGIGFGNGNVESGPTNTLYYAAGGNNYLTGVFGAITAN